MEKDVAILMADLTGYTAMTGVHGGASAARIVHKYMQIVDSALCGTAKLIQRVGDQVVVIAENADDLAITAKTIHNLTLGEDQFLPIHAGIHFGPVFFDNGNLFGSTINVSSRIMNLANRGQILCSRQFIIRLTHTFPFTSKGTFKLKNVLDEIELFELTTQDPISKFNIDPVCHMHVDTGRPDYCSTFNKVTYYFCSDHCKTLFESSPESFLQQHNSA